MLLIPGGLIALIGLHLYLVVRLGVTSPPWSKHAAGRERKDEVDTRKKGLLDPQPRDANDDAPGDGGGGGVSAPAARAKPEGDPRRAEFARYKEDVKREGKPFFPYAMFHDTVMSLVVVAVIIGLACIWYFTSGEEAGDSGILGPRYTDEADPATIPFVPRPDWYFYFLFYLLRIFKWPESVVLGTVGIPTIALILLLAMPFIDRRRERRLLHRPVAVIAAVARDRFDGGAHLEGRDREGGARERDVDTRVDRWMQENNLPEEARPGAVIFAPPAASTATRTSATARRTSARPTSPRRARARPRHPVADRPPEGSACVHAGLADAALPRTSPTRSTRTRHLPRGLRQVARGGTTAPRTPSFLFDARLEQPARPAATRQGAARGRGHATRPVRAAAVTRRTAAAAKSRLPSTTG